MNPEPPIGETLVQAGATVALLNVLGAYLKQSRVPNRFIPAILPVAGAAAECVFKGAWSPVNVLNGAIAGMAAVGAHQLVTRTKKPPQ